MTIENRRAHCTQNPNEMSQTSPIEEKYQWEVVHLLRDGRRVFFPERRAVRSHNCRSPLLFMNDSSVSYIAANNLITVVTRYDFQSSRGFDIFWCSFKALVAKRSYTWKVWAGRSAHVLLEFVTGHSRAANWLISLFVDQKFDILRHSRCIWLYRSKIPEKEYKGKSSMIYIYDLSFLSTEEVVIQLIGLIISFLLSKARKWCALNGFFVFGQVWITL